MKEISKRLVVVQKPPVVGLWWLQDWRLGWSMRGWAAWSRSSWVFKGKTRSAFRTWLLASVLFHHLILYNNRSDNAWGPGIRWLEDSRCQVKS